MPEPKIRKTRNFRSLTITLTLSFLFLSLTLLIIITGINAYLNFKTNQKFIVEQQQFIAKEAANEVRNFIQERFNILNKTSSIGDLAVPDQKKQKLVLEKLLGLEPSFRQLIVLDLQGEETARVSRLSNLISSQLTIQDKEKLLSEIKEGKQYVSSVYIDETTSEPMIIITVPVTNIFHDIKGILMAEVNLKFMWDLIANIKIGENGAAYVVNKEGNLIAYADISRVLKGENLIYLEEVSEFVNSNRSVVEGDVHTSIDLRISKGINNGNVITNYVPLELVDWAVVVELPVLEAYKDTIISLEMTLLSLIACFVLAVILGIYLSKKIINPIIRLRNIVVKIGEGNLNTQIKMQSNNEIGELAAAFNQMINDLKKSRAELKKYSQNLEKQVEIRTEQLNEKAKDSENTKIATLNILDDIDESNRKLVIAQAKLKQDIDELKKLDVQKDQFISIAAHELKTPMTSIRGFSNLLNNPKIAENPELRKKYLDIIFKDTTRLASLISNVLELSRMDLGVLKIGWQNIKVPELIKEVREQMDVIIKSKNLKSEYKIESNLPIISIDKDKMIQVISNLINNAMHYTEKGKIGLEAKKSNGNILFSVSDTGMGIPKEHLKEIFERFYQVDNPLTRKINGTGLGLSLCKGFVEAMGGKIWAESEIGKGTTFYFTIPTKRKKADEMREIDIFKENKEPDKKEIKTPEKDSLKTKKK